MANLKVKDLVYYKNEQKTYDILKINGVIADAVRTERVKGKTVNIHKKIPLNKKLVLFKTLQYGNNYYFAV